MTFDAYRTDPAKFIDDFLPLNEKGEPWQLSPHQRKVLKLAMRFSAEGRLVGLRYLVWGEPKKSGKTLLAAAVVTWWAYTRPHTEVIAVANDEKQAVGRVFRTLVALVTQNAALASSATMRATWITFSNGSRVDAIALDYTGEAGGRQSLVSYDEPWGIMSERARRLFEELTPPPSEAESWVLMTTTAGFNGESELLETLYRTGMQGERLDDELEVYRAGAVTMFWSHTPRQPWQTPEYYEEQRQTLRPNAFKRLHQNEWVTGTESFIAAEDWDACVDETLVPVLGGFRFRTVHAVDFAPKHDFTARVSVSIQGDRLVLVGHRIWKPAPGEPLDLEETVERDLRECHGRGHCAAIVVDPYQMHGSITRLQKAGLPIREIPQTQPNTAAFSQSLYDALKGRNLVMYPSRDLREEALNAVAVETGRAWRLAKEKASRKIDAVVALAMCVHACIEERGVSRTTAAAIYPGGGSTPPDNAWRLPYFGLRPKRRSLLDGLMNAPRPPHTSQAMLDARAEEAAAIAHQERLDRESAKHVERLRDDEAKRQQQQREADYRTTLAAMPPEERERARKRFGSPKE
jgi:phage terminase large subunit-like protein